MKKHSLLNGIVKIFIIPFLLFAIHLNMQAQISLTPGLAPGIYLLRIYNTTGSTGGWLVK